MFVSPEVYFIAFPLLKSLCSSTSSSYMCCVKTHTQVGPPPPALRSALDSLWLQPALYTKLLGQSFPTCLYLSPLRISCQPSTMQLQEEPLKRVNGLITPKHNDMVLNIKSYVRPYWSDPCFNSILLCSSLSNLPPTSAFSFSTQDHTSSCPYPTESCFGNLTHSVSSS